MEYKIIRSASHTTKEWSNGTSKQLFIYPDSSSYEEKNFIIRASTATVESDTSVFANLPNHKRSIILLNGNVSLEDKNNAIVELQNFKPHFFDGNMGITSHGKGTDFNFMVKDGNKFDVKTFELENDPQGLTLYRDKNYERHFHFFYLLNGHLEIHTQNEHIALKKEDVLIIKLQSKDQVDVNLTGHGKMIFCEVFFNL